MLTNFNYGFFIMENSTPTPSTQGQLKTKAPLWFILTLLAVAGLAVNFGMSLWKKGQAGDLRTAAADVQSLTGQILQSSHEAAQGNFEAYESLARARQEMDVALGKLSNNGEGKRTLAGQIEEVRKAWGPVAKHVETIGTAEPPMQILVRHAEKVLEGGHKLQALASELAGAQAMGAGSPAQTGVAVQQAIAAGNMMRTIAEIRDGGRDLSLQADNLKREFALFDQRMSRMTEAQVVPAAASTVRNFKSHWAIMRKDLHQVVDTLPQAISVQLAAQGIRAGANDLSKKGQELVKSASDEGTMTDTTLFPNIWWNLVFAVMAVIFGSMFITSRQRLKALQALQQTLQQKLALEEQKEQNARTQQSITRLLNEIAELGSGDLTVMAPVTEDVTGAIADAINYAVEQLRNLVETINSSAVSLDEKTRQTQSSAMQMVNAADMQIEQISSAANRVNEMASSVEHVSGSSMEAADVAQRAVLIASEGSSIVKETINGMDQIRDQIQETSKRIKRLGESSQEIGSIVELINDISEQTNILSLNAAMRAAAAGEEGRGFTVVADEVQRLADRTSAATKRIESLVLTIQADTNSAVSSMEQTTSEVVSGARLAEDAGMALTEIVKVSQNLEAIIMRISTATKQQAQAAVEINDAMRIISEISEQTHQSAGESAHAIGQLAEIASNLRKAADGFKLPNK